MISIRTIDFDRGKKSKIDYEKGNSHSTDPIFLKTRWFDEIFGIQMDFLNDLG